jgi:hypothetical protein
MGFLRRDDDDADSQNAPAAPRDVATTDAPHAARYESGSLAGIPDSGKERIARMKKEVERGFFTSDLSVNEFLLVKESGFEPLGLVLGSSIYHIGFQQAGWNQNQEMGVLTQAMYHARELAMTRLWVCASTSGAMSGAPTSPSSSPWAPRSSTVAESCTAHPTAARSPRI